MRPTTRARIEAAHRHSAFYRGGFANHLPMALVALDAMGADEAAIERFSRRYERQLEPIGAAAVAIDRDNAPQLVGRPEAFPSWAAFFAQSIERRGTDAVLEEWLTRLSPGVGAAAFHGAIRTAYALESQSAAELAHALAYWTAAFTAVDEVELRGRETPAAVLASLAGKPTVRIASRSIAQRARAAAAAPGFEEAVARVDPGALTLEALAGASIEAYCASGDFTLLHAVTGAHALRLLGERTPDPAPLVRHFWTSLAAAYLGAGAPEVQGWALQGDATLDWPAIHARAALCDDEHDIKLAYSCWRESQWRGGELYRRAASARVSHAMVGESA